MEPTPDELIESELVCWLFEVDMFCVLVVVLYIQIYF